MKKLRLDEMVAKHLNKELNKELTGLIMSGKVMIDNEVADKPGMLVNPKSKIDINTKKKYATRSGYKLEKAINYFNINLTDKIAIDIGASEGGFTDCMLDFNVGKVYAVDVAYGIFCWRLRNNPKVIVIERKNARYLTKENISECADFIATDVSFISLKKIFPTINNFLLNDGECACLVKPQFEAKPQDLGKNGNIKDPKIIEAILSNICDEANKNNLFINGLTYSPIKGNNGNIEYLLYLKRTSLYNVDETLDIISKTVQESFLEESFE